MSTHGYFLDPNIAPAGFDSRLGHFRSRDAFARFASTYDDGMAQLPAVDETLAITTSFGRVRAYRFGTRGGTPLVLLAGRQSSTPLWRANIAPLAQHHDVWSLDSIGEPGASTQTAALTSTQDQVTWVDEALAALPADRVHLMGVSIGGWLAAQCALQAPDRLASVVLLDPATTFANLTLQMVLVSLGSVIPGMPQWLRHRLLSRISGGARSSDDIPEGRLVSSGMRDFAQKMPQPRMPDRDARTSVTVPMLVLLGGRSIVHDPQKAARAARAVPGAQVEVWPAASHAINGEHPIEIADRVGEFTATLR